MRTVLAHDRQLFDGLIDIPCMNRWKFLFRLILAVDRGDGVVVEYIFPRPAMSFLFWICLSRCASRPNELSLERAAMQTETAFPIVMVHMQRGILLPDSEIKM
jgi:hypothetical protein